MWYYEYISTYKIWCSLPEDSNLNLIHCFDKTHVRVKKGRVGGSTNVTDKWKWWERNTWDMREGGGSMKEIIPIWVSIGLFPNLIYRS